MEYPNNLSCLQQLFIASVGLLLTPDLGMIEATFGHDSLAVAHSFCLEGMALLGENGVPKQLVFSPTVLTWVFVASVG